MSEKYKNLATNIRNLRRAYGETQRELADALHVSEHAISQYESGKRVPDLQKIKDISFHYGLPLDRLLEDDFSQSDFKMDSLTWEKMLSIFEAQFPIICSNSAMQNQHFINGYQHTLEIWNKMKTPFESIMCITFERALDEYELSLIECPEIVEAAANMLWLIFIKYALLPDEHSVKMGEAVLFGKSMRKDFVKKYVLNDSNPTSEKNIENKKGYVKDIEEAIIALIRILKESADYSDLADYYVGIRYAVGMVDNDYGNEMNKTIGIEMLTEFALLGNKYALNYFRKVHEI